MTGDLADLESLVGLGLTDAELGKVLGCSERTARRRRLAAGLARGTGPRAFVADAKLLELHDRSLTPAQIAAEVGLSPATVRERLIGLGLHQHRPPKGRTRPVGLDVRWTAEEAAAIRAAASSWGISVSELVRRRVLAQDASDGLRPAPPLLEVNVEALRERAAIVEWLRKPGASPAEDEHAALFAEAIDAGKHLKAWW